MGSITKERLVALSGVLAALLPAVIGAAGLVSLTSWYPGRGVLTTFGVVAGIAAVVIGVVARRRTDGTSFAFAVAVVLFALNWVPLPTALWPVSAIITVATQAVLIAFGVLVVRRSTGLPRVLGWFIAVGSVLWLLGVLVLFVAARPDVSQEVLGVLLLISPIGMVVAFTAAALLYVGPLVRPVAQGARYLWSTADVR